MTDFMAAIHQHWEVPPIVRRGRRTVRPGAAVTFGSISVCRLAMNVCQAGSAMRRSRLPVAWAMRLRVATADAGPVNHWADGLTGGWALTGRYTKLGG